MSVNSRLSVPEFVQGLKPPFFISIIMTLLILNSCACYGAVPEIKYGDWEAGKTAPFAVVACVGLAPNDNSYTTDSETAYVRAPLGKAPSVEWIHNNRWAMNKYEVMDFLIHNIGVDNQSATLMINNAVNSWSSEYHEILDNMKGNQNVDVQVMVGYKKPGLHKITVRVDISSVSTHKACGWAKVFSKQLE